MITRHELELPPANPRSKPDPAILEFINVSMSDSNKRRKIQLTFYHIAGEVFDNDWIVGEHAPFLSNANDIIFMFNPIHTDFNALRAALLIDLVHCSVGRRKPR